MKKTVALLLALMLLLPSMIIVNAADGITIDGKLDEAIWLPNAWINVGAGDWETPQPTRNESFDMQFRTDDANLYVAVKTNFAPKGTDTLFGNGNASIFRLWTFVDGRKKGDVEYSTYNNIIEYLELKMIITQLMLLLFPNTCIPQGKYRNKMIISAHHLFINHIYIF